MSAMKATTVVLPGRRIEFSAPELPVGCTVDVSVTIPPAALRPSRIADLLASLPVGPRSAASWPAFEQDFADERAAWER